MYRPQKGRYIFLYNIVDRNLFNSWNRFKMLDFRFAKVTKIQNPKTANPELHHQIWNRRIVATYTVKNQQNKGIFQI